MTPAAAKKHLAGVLTKMEEKEAELQQRCGDVYPQSVRARDKKTIQALRTLLAGAGQTQKEPKQ